MRYTFFCITVLAAFSGCDQTKRDVAPGDVAPSVSPRPVTPEDITSSTLAPSQLTPKSELEDSSADTAAALQIIRTEWARAGNRAQCAPLAFKQTGDTTAKARRANFAGGWAVAYDTPAQRSAYGLAGPGLTALDQAEPAEQRGRLARQWPLFRDLEELRQPAFAGYGVEGATPYPPANPEGKGLNSLAYVRVGGQRCTYNVWTHLGRKHLEFLLENLVPIRP